MSLNKLVKILLVAILIAIPSASHAQSQSTQATILWEHDGVLTTGYRVYIDNVVVTSVVNDSTVCQAGVIRTCQASVPLTNAPHTIAVSAFNATAEAKSPTLNWGGELLPPGTPKVTIKLVIETVIK